MEKKLLMHPTCNDEEGNAANCDLRVQRVQHSSDHPSKSSSGDLL